ncbi:MAG: hypothetical protein H0U69_02835 [Trueperaceae bacterium]|nr:hypothetical protein [Trueperaceae bacterium]
MTPLRTLTLFATAVVLASCAQTPPGTQIVSVVVSPASAQLAPNASRDFSATVSGAAGGVAWQRTCGQIIGSGTTITYVAPSFETECTLTATSVAAPQASDSVVIQVSFEEDADVTVDSNTNSTQSVTMLDMGAGETVWVRVNVPTSQTGVGRRLVVEAADDEGAVLLDMVLYESDGTTPTASTSGTAYFRPELEGVGEGFVGTALEPGAPRPLRDTGGEVERSVSVVGNCFGPCISRAAPAGLSHVYVRVTHLGFSSETVPFYAYTETFIDEEEPVNNAPSGAVSVSTTDSYRGALETLDDVDWIFFEQDGVVGLTQRPEYDVLPILVLFDANEQEIGTFGPGELIPVLAGDRGAVISDDQDPEGPRASVYGWYEVGYD